MSDLISRQAAVDAIYHHLPSVSRTEVRLMLHEVPSAQPDILTCEDCKYADDKPISDGRHCCSIHGSFMYYCSDAERREE